MEPMRLALRPGQVVEIEDHWRKLKNIDNAIRCGLLEVVTYNYSHVGEEVTHAELTKILEDYEPGGGIELDDLSVVQLPPSGTGSLVYDNTTGVFTYTPPYCEGGGGGGSDINLELSVYPEETPDGAHRTFTLPNGHHFEHGTLIVIINGQTLPPEDVIAADNGSSVTLHPEVSTPKTDDVVVLTYMRTVFPIETGETPIETPDGVNKTFSLQHGDVFVDDNVGMMINGIFVAPDCIIKASDGTSVTLVPAYPAPEVDDIVVLMYSRTTGYPIEINVYSVEQPDGANRTFTLPSGHVYITEKVELLINGQRLPKEDFMQNSAQTSVTLDPAVSTPESDDSATLIYMRFA